MKITVLSVGRVRGLLAAAVEEYEERASRYWKLEVVEVAAGTGGGGDGPPEVRRVEGERLLGRLPEGVRVVALTRNGKGMTSKGVARWLQRLAVRGHPGACFLIGGAHGLSDPVLDRSDRRLALSPMTLPHEMARLVLAEQLYRAGTIVRGEPYHKGGGR